MRGSGGGGPRRTGRQNPVALGDGPAPAAAAAQTRPAPASAPPRPPRTAVPAEQAAPDALPARSPGAAAPHTQDHGGDGGAPEDDGYQEGDNDVVRPETINESRRDSDNARLLLAGDDVLEGFDKCGVSSLITHICLISVLQLADLFLYAGQRACCSICCFGSWNTLQRQYKPRNKHLRTLHQRDPIQRATNATW